jgi:DNA-directed RNA polymerase specialized sigma24 family protein
MTAGQVPGFDESPPLPSSFCPCGHGDVVAELDREGPLLTRAAGGDARAFGQLYDAHVDDVYRYLLAWTCQEASARELTQRVFDGAVNWLPSIAEGESDLSTWLVTMARDSLIEHREAGLLADGGIEGQTPDVLLAATRLDDAQRDVVVMRLLLGHSVAHTAQLAGYPERVVTDLQFAACAAVWQVLSGAPIEQPPDGDERRRPVWFEHYLDGAYPDPGTDQGLSDVLAVADALRRTAPREVPLPDDAFVAGMRARLLIAMGGEQEPRPSRGGRIAGAFSAVRFHIGRHPWVTTTIAAAAIGIIFGLQAAGSLSHSACGSRPCLVSTTRAAASPQVGVGVPSVSSAPGSGATTTLPTTSERPTTTVARTTRAPVTTPPTTEPPTTTTAPAPKTTQAPTTTAQPSSTTTHRPTTTASTPTTVTR